jgi:hypothetical protein
MLPAKLFEKMDELIALHEKQTDLMRQLKKAYMLANLIGQHPNQIEGKLSWGFHTCGTPLYARPWKTAEMVIRLDGVEVARKKMIDVPHDFWPADVLAEYQRQLRRNKKTYQE